MSIIKRVRIGRSSSQGRSQASLARSSAIMASGTLVSRILGMVRNALIVMALGATGSGAADAFNTANNLPTYLYNMMIGGSSTRSWYRRSFRRCDGATARRSSTAS